MSLPKSVKIVEVGPRDGLQNEQKYVPTDIKIQFIKRLIKSGLTTIEATSFVSPKWVPQMADHTEVLQKLKRVQKVNFPVLVPNKHGLEKAMHAGAKEIAIFCAASTTFSKRNINLSINDSLKQYQEIVSIAKSQHIKTRGYISCVLGCPYEGDVNRTTVAKIAARLINMGCYEVSLGDTIGVGTARNVEKLIKRVATKIPVHKIAVHFHDTYGQALVNIFAALQLGIKTIDSSVAGLGGCPYAQGASGNVATEDVVYMLNGLGIKSNVDLKKLIKAGDYICDYLGHPTRSKVATATL